MRISLFIVVFVLFFSICRNADSQIKYNNNSIKNSLEITSKPFTRYWWFASEIQKEDVMVKSYIFNTKSVAGLIN
ncbi:MAG: hypothetical protein RO257_12900 [Candidatus Kapabacteria bacterium]|nr:hypothetical protein [Candidatus Kapabacteria bacterium]